MTAVPQRIAFFEFRLDTASGEHLGGSGIFLTSLVAFLRGQQARVPIRFIPCEPATQQRKGRWQKARAFLHKQWRDIADLLSPDEEILLFHYPKIPIYGRSSLGKVLIFAVLGYGLLAVKTMLTGQKVAVLIQDLPAEQRLIGNLPAAPDLSRFQRLQRLPQSEWAGFVVERILFRSADWIIVPSRLLGEHIVQKHGLARAKILLKRRDIYMPRYDADPRQIELAAGPGPRIFYSGSLWLPEAIDNLKRIMWVLRGFPAAHFYLCGQGGRWVPGWVRENGIANVHYLGVLDYATHDAVVQKCDIGLLIYAHSYYDLMATAKYSAYVANGLAVLGTDLVTLTEMIAEDRVGEAVSEHELAARLVSWLLHPEQIQTYRAQRSPAEQRLSRGTVHAGMV